MRIGTLIAAATASGFLALCLCTSSLAAGAIHVQSTSVEYASNPLGIDAHRPRLSWVLGSQERNQEQRAYQIRVASSLSQLEKPDVWNSGKIDSPQSTLVPYAGARLASRTRYYWQARVWDKQGRTSDWSQPSWWETGLISAKEWRAEWIGHDQALPLPTTFAMYNAPAALQPGETQGQSFAADKPFTSVAIPAPTFITTNAGMTVSLYAGGPSGELIARRRFENHADNAWATLVLDKPAAPGKYYIEESEATGRIGWWTSEKGGYGYGEAYLNGKPVAGDRSLRWAPTSQVVNDGLSPQLRKEFPLSSEIASARLYATALGLYQVEINGKRVGNDVLAPGWTDYNKRVQYQTYDVTALLSQGRNAIGVTLAPGWYAGNIAAFGPGQYGRRPYLLMQLEVRYKDGGTEWIVTDGSWKSGIGPVVQADLIMGQHYDARSETPGWSLAGFNDTKWRAVLVNRDIRTSLVAQVDPPVRVVRELKPVKITRVGSHTFIYDLGQNIVGVARLRVSGKTGQEISMRHAEVLDGNGRLYTDNLRTARATDTYILKGGGPEAFEPRFTFHGFRYVEVSGTDNQPDITGLVIHNDAPLTMSFTTDVPMLNQLQSNIAWSQRGNFLSVPTDTPARDERLGWTGDIAAFAGTATYNMESARFLRKWLTDLRDTQSRDGAYADVAPTLDSIDLANAGWGDAGVIVPWTLYERYGDLQILRDSFASMAQWVAYLKKHSQRYLRPDSGYGDWLNIGDETPKDLIATAFFAHSAELTARAARLLGKDARPYDTLAERVRTAFRKAYVLPNGQIKGDTQTAYVLALSMDLLPASSRKRALDRLAKLIECRNWHLSTGFLGTPRLLAALSEHGRTDIAYRLLLQTSFPSWGYQIGKGATTMWERWDAIRPDGTFQDKRMNSFNHYAYGSVGEWMYQNIAGIRPAAPGFKKILIQPQPASAVRQASGRYESVLGPIEVRWTADGSRMDLDVSIPVNSIADIRVPATSAQRIETDGARLLYRKPDHAVYRVGSGKYRVVVR